MRVEQHAHQHGFYPRGGNEKISIGNLNFCLAVTEYEGRFWRFEMNTAQVKGDWRQLVGKAKEKWGRLTDDDWKIVEGKRDQLVGRIQERYGIAREEAERQLAELERS
jgi:uncharacterized protein YjbJ (UPF0337 family)